MILTRTGDPPGLALKNEPNRPPQVDVPPASEGTAAHCDPPPPVAAPQGPAPSNTTPLTAPREKRWPLVEALQCILDDRHQDALRYLEAYDAETQKFYLRILPPLTAVAQKGISELSPQEVAVLNEQLHSLLIKLRPYSEFGIGRMCYCDWIINYGIYHPLAEGHAFAAPTSERPGELVELYVELVNFASVPRGVFFETKLSSMIEIYNARGEKVRVLKFKQEEEPPVQSLSRLNDFHNVYSFVVPDLPRGPYQLVLQVADETIPGSRRVARKSLEFRIR